MSEGTTDCTRKQARYIIPRDTMVFVVFFVNVVVFLLY